MITTPTLRTSTKRPGLARHGDSRSSRSVPQRSDDRQARNRRLCNPRREKVCAASPLSFSSSFLLSLTTTIVVIATSSLPGSFPHSLHHHPALPPTILFSPQLFTNKSSHLSNAASMIVRHGPGLFLWIDLVERTRERACGRQCRCSWWSSPARLHCAKLQAAKESDSLVCEARPGETVPVSQPSPSVSHLISFYSNLLVSLFFSLPFDTLSHLLVRLSILLSRIFLST